MINELTHYWAAIAFLILKKNQPRIKKTELTEEPRGPEPVQRYPSQTTRASVRWILRRNRTGTSGPVAAAASQSQAAPHACSTCLRRAEDSDTVSVSDSE